MQQVLPHPNVTIVRLLNRTQYHIDSNLAFIGLPTGEEYTNTNGSKGNLMNVVFICDLIVQLHDKGIQTQDMLVLTPFQEQYQVYCAVLFHLKVSVGREYSNMSDTTNLKKKKKVGYPYWMLRLVYHAQDRDRICAVGLFGTSRSKGPMSPWSTGCVTCSTPRMRPGASHLW